MCHTNTCMILQTHTSNSTSTLYPRQGQKSCWVVTPQFSNQTGVKKICWKTHFWQKSCILPGLIKRYLHKSSALSKKQAFLSCLFAPQTTASHHLLGLNPMLGLWRNYVAMETEDCRFSEVYWTGFILPLIIIDHHDRWENECCHMFCSKWFLSLNVDTDNLASHS